MKLRFTHFSITGGLFIYLTPLNPPPGYGDVFFVGQVIGTPHTSKLTMVLMNSIIARTGFRKSRIQPCQELKWETPIMISLGV